MVAGAQRLLETVRSGPSRSTSTGRSCPSSSDPTESDLVEHVRRETQTLYHPVGTCAMGAGEQAVVDPELRVRGIEGLRVADASVMPMVTRGNTNAPTIMVGEKAADLLQGKSSAMTDKLESSTRRPVTSSGSTPSTTRRPWTQRSPGPVTRPSGGRAARPPTARSVLDQWKGVLTRRMAQLADVVHQETGKPHGDAQLEVGLAIEHLAWAAANAGKVLGRRRVAVGAADGEPGGDAWSTSRSASSA